PGDQTPTFTHTSGRLSLSRGYGEPQSQPRPFLHASGWITVALFETRHCGVTREPMRVFMRRATPDY
ncbi:hypothetical protein KUCAC02_024459, partial [Chaenocephalus aceratus]